MDGMRLSEVISPEVRSSLFEAEVRNFLTVTRGLIFMIGWVGWD